MCIDIDLEKENASNKKSGITLSEHAIQALDVGCFTYFLAALPVSCSFGMIA